eukprot:4987992-Pyramimonas_sp.AAC.1
MAEAAASPGPSDEPPAVPSETKKEVPTAKRSRTPSSASGSGGARGGAPTAIGKALHGKVNYRLRSSPPEPMTK